MAHDLRPKNWPYRADLPQRYGENAGMYRARGGEVRLEDDVAGFVADGDLGDVSRFLFFCLVQDQLQKEGLDGDVAEVGVYRGATASVLARIARRKGAKLWLFDTFEGFSPEDLTGVDADKAQAFEDTSVQAVLSRVGAESVEIVQGRFPHSAGRIPPDLRFCLVHIDCDLYEPIRAALEHFYPRMAPGGFIVMHDYSSLAWNGAEQAIDEFFADKPESVVPLTDGAGSCVVRRARDPGRDPHWSRRPLSRGTWLQAGGDRLRAALGDGWSGAEEWGVWGVGPTHALLLPASAEPMRLEVDCAMALPGAIDWQAVTVAAGGRALDVWQFTPAQNRAVRQVTIPPALAGEPASRVTVTFHPSEPILRPCDVDPSNSDDRPLGLALHRLRLEG
jgi:hypothetical protein